MRLHMRAASPTALAKSRAGRPIARGPGESDLITTDATEPAGQWNFDLCRHFQIPIDSRLRAKRQRTIGHSSPRSGPAENRSRPKAPRAPIGLKKRFARSPVRVNRWVAPPFHERAHPGLVRTPNGTAYRSHPELSLRHAAGARLRSYEVTSAQRHRVAAAAAERRTSFKEFQPRRGSPVFPRQ
jgi:hypothetical protein